MKEEIEPNRALACNPSLPGAKAEEAFVLGLGGPENLRASPDRR